MTVEISHAVVGLSLRAVVPVTFWFSGSACCYFSLLDLVSLGLPLVLAGAA